MDFRLSWDAYAWRVTGGSCLVTAMLLFGPILVGKFRERPENGWAFQLVGFILFAISLVCALLAPWRYSLSPDSLRVHAVLRGYSIPLQDIAEVRIAKGHEFFSGASRTSAIAGLFGYSGKFASNSSPNFQVDSGQIAGNIVVIRRKSGQILVLGPDDPDRFVARLNDARAK